MAAEIIIKRIIFFVVNKEQYEIEVSNDKKYHNINYFGADFILCDNFFF